MGSDYPPQTWTNGDITHPINAVRLNILEQGVANHDHARLHAGLKSLLLGTDGSLLTPAGFSIWPVSGVPDDADGADDDWAISDNGLMYFKVDGAWGEATGGGAAPSLTVGAAPADHTYVIGDIADPDSYWGDSLVVYFSWTPTKSGTVTLYPPKITAEVDGGATTDRDYFVFEGATLGVDYPGITSAPYSGPDSISNPSWTNRSVATVNNPVPGAIVQPDPLTVTAGQVYTIAIVDYDDVVIAGHAASYLEFFQSVQQLGGVVPLVPPVQGTPLILADGDVEPSAAMPSAAGGHSEGEGYASGTYAHAEGAFTIARADYSHAEGYATGTAAGSPYAHAEGYRTAGAGQSAHAEGEFTVASGPASHAEGRYSHAVLPGSHAWASASIDSGVTIKQGIRVPLAPIQTTNATEAVFKDGDLATLYLINGVWAIQGFVVARRTDVVGTCSYWRFDALIESHVSASPFIRIIGHGIEMVYQDPAAAPWAVNIDIHDGLDLRIRVTGEAAKTIDWFCSFEGGLVQ